MTAWLPIITPLAAAILFAFFSVWMEKNQNKEKISNGNQSRPAGQKKSV